MPARSTPDSSLSAPRFGVSSLPLRRAALTALLTALLGGAVGAAVGAAHQDTFTARATFVILQRPADVEALSRNRALLAEQAVRRLREGRADRIADRAARTAAFDADWEVGPGYGELSYQVTATDPAVATRVARAVYDDAGFLGLTLVKPGQEPPVLDLDEVTVARPDEPSTALVAAVSGLVSGLAGFVVTVAFAVRPRAAVEPSPARGGHPPPGDR